MPVQLKELKLVRSMKTDLLNGLLHISINGPPVNTKEADNLIMRVVDKYVNQRHYKAPTIYTAVTTTSSSSTQTETVEVNVERHRHSN